MASTTSGGDPLLVLERLKGAAKTFGTEFEFKLAGLLALRARALGLDFRLYTNVAVARPLDDIVLRVLKPQPCIVFIQLKHAGKAGKATSVTTQAFTSPKGDFSLQKYFAFYADFVSKYSPPGDLVTKDDALLHESAVDDVRVVVYSNRRVARRKGARDAAHLHFPLEGLLRTDDGSRPGAVFSFGREDDEVWKLYDNDPLKDVYQHEFLPRLRVFSEQAHVNDLDKLIQKELDALFGAPLPRSEYLLVNYITTVKDWALDDARGHPLTNSSGEVERVLVEELVRQGRQASGDGALLFTRERCAALRALLERGRDSVKVRVCGVRAGHRAAKAVQVLDEAFAGRWTYVGDRQLRDFPRAALEAACGAGHVQFVVLDVEEEGELEDALALVDAVARDVRVVAVSSGEGESLRRSLGRQWVAVEDDWRMGHLTAEAQEAMMKASLTFQGCAMPLQSLAPSWSSLAEDVDGAFLSALLCGEAAVGAAPLAPAEGAYFPRTLEHRSTLDPAVLGALDPRHDHLVLSGFPASALETLARGLAGAGEGATHRLPAREDEGEATTCDDTADKKDDTKDADQEYISDERRWTVVCPGHSAAVTFREVCQRDPARNVHWLQHCGSRGAGRQEGQLAVAWRATRGSRAAVAPFVRVASAVCRRTPTCVHSEQAARHAAAWTQRAALLVAEPGMGKSRFLQRLAAEARALAPRRWALLLHAHRHRNLLQRLPDAQELTMEHLLELLVEAAGIATPPSAATKAARSYLEAAAFGSGNIAVFIDGVDEICPSFKDKFIQLLNLLLETPVQLVWVSSRPQVEDALREVLKCPTSSLRPFTVAEQNDYLCRYWASACDQSPEEFKALAGEMVAALHSAAGQGRRSLLDVMLHAQMAAEAYESKAIHALTTGGRLLPEGGITLYELYRSFVDKKRGLCKERFGLTDASFVNLPIVDNFDEVHQNCAMFVLLSTGAYNNVDTQQFAEYLALNRNNISKEKNGIMWLEDDGTPHFLHSTFVEFFAASWILSHANTNTAKGLWCSLLDSKKGAGMKQILEHMLVEGLPLHHAVLEGREQALDELLESATVDCFGRTPLQQAASLGRADAVGALLARGFDPGSRDALLGWTALQYASASGHLQAADRLLQAGADASQLVVDDVNAALFSAADLGLKHVMICLLNIGANVNWRKHGLTPLMISSIRGHTMNVQLLLENGADLHQRSDEGQTALHYASAGCHREVMQLLLDRGAKPRETSVDRTPLMLASEKGNALCVRLLLQYGADAHKKIHLTSALHFASENSHFEVVGILLEAGADPNDRNKRNESPLMLVSKNNSPSIATLLLEHGANVHAVDNGKWTALHYAAANERLEVMTVLLDNNADPNPKTKWGMTPLMMAATNNNVLVVRLLILHGADVHQHDIHKRTALHFASDKCHHEIINLLLQSGADPNAETKWNTTPLMLASKNGCALSAGLLLQHGSNIHNCDSQKKTALHHASAFDHLQVLQLLLEKGANPNLKDKWNTTPLMVASKRSSGSAVRLLLKYGADVHQSDTNMKTAIHFSCSGGNQETITLLLESGADPNAKNKWNTSPLMISSKQGSTTSVRLLLQHGADLHQRDENLRTPLHYASENGHDHVMQFLLKSGADPNPKDRYESTPLMIVSKQDDVSSARILLQYGADVNLCDIDNETALHHAARAGNHKILNLLLESDADPNAKNKLNISPLMFASKNGNVSCVKLLLQYGANVHQCCNCNESALQYASKNGRLEVMKLLLNVGADPNTKNFRNLSSLMSAVSGGHLSCVELLLRHGADVHQRDGEINSALHLATLGGHREIVKLLQRSTDPNYKENNRDLLVR